MYQHVGAQHGEYSKKSNSIRFLYGEMFRRWKIFRSRCVGVCAKETHRTNTGAEADARKSFVRTSERGTLWSERGVGASILQRAENALLSPSSLGLPWNFTVFMKWHNLCRTMGGEDGVFGEDDALCPSQKGRRNWRENPVVAMMRKRRPTCFVLMTSSGW